MTDTNVTIKGKRGCSDTGITEELASKLYVAAENRKVTEVVAIVRFKTDFSHSAADGSTRAVDLSIVDIEPVVDGKLNGALVNHVHDIQAALFRNRKLSEGGTEQLPFDEVDGPAPKVADIVQQGGAFLDHDDDGATIHVPEDETDDEPVPLDPDDPEMPDDPAAQDEHATTSESIFSGS